MLVSHASTFILFFQNVVFLLWLIFFCFFFALLKGMELILPVLLSFIKTFEMNAPVEKMENGKNLFFKNYVLLQIVFHEVVFVAILVYSLQK